MDCMRSSNTKIENYKICGRRRLRNYISVNVRTKVGNMNANVISSII